MKNKDQEHGFKFPPNCCKWCHGWLLHTHTHTGFCFSTWRQQWGWILITRLQRLSTSFQTHKPERFFTLGSFYFPSTLQWGRLNPKQGFSWGKNTFPVDILATAFPYLYFPSLNLNRKKAKQLHIGNLFYAFAVFMTLCGLLRAADMPLIKVMVTDGDLRLEED